ncbi:MAG: type II toxin-antitoxin system Phd/YefM family antitoxin [Acidimicrobiia bacterium]|nr:type II toxin-antitoxin system Phd/YefM family antitoxin [Acidimicrobiia bacterium]
MAITASKLRENVYRVLDEVLASGEPVEIERNGRRLFIVAEAPPSRLGRLVSRPELVTGNSEDLIHLDWSGEWSGSGE